MGAMAWRGADARRMNDRYVRYRITGGMALASLGRLVVAAGAGRTDCGQKARSHHACTAMWTEPSCSGGRAGTAQRPDANGSAMALSRQLTRGIVQRHW